MLFTINALLLRAGISVEDTVYEKDAPGVRGYIISSGDFYELAAGSGECKIYGRNEDISWQGSGDMNWEELAYYSQRLSELKSQLKAMKNDEEDITHAHADEIKALRKEKKRISSMLEAVKQKEKEKLLIKFKNSLYATSFAAICRYIPKLGAASFRDSQKMPLFTAGIPELKAAVEQGRPLGICGGPCLFGVNEVLVEAVLDDGTVLHYDFSSGRHFIEGSSAGDLCGDMEALGKRVVSIDFINRKMGVTTQEYDSIHILFECAKALGAKLAIPLPDMSYIKYLTNIIEPLPEKVRREALEKFRREAFAIGDMYLELIEKLKYMYPAVETAVIHERDTGMCRIFYEKRAPFLTETTIRRLTGIQGKNDAIQDYITMPALPYYLWGITDIIQIDSLDETDSYRKCAKLHKGVLKLYGMLYPERLSGDGENTIFYAPMEYKEYLVKA